MVCFSLGNEGRASCRVGLPRRARRRRTPAARCRRPRCAASVGYASSGIAQAPRVGELRHETDVGERRRAPWQNARSPGRARAAPRAPRGRARSSAGTRRSSPSSLTPSVRVRYCSTRRLSSGWMSQAIASAMRAHAGARLGRAGSSGGCGIALVEVLDDRERLRERRRARRRAPARAPGR